MHDSKWPGTYPGAILGVLSPGYFDDGHCDQHSYGAIPVVRLIVAMMCVLGGGAFAQPANMIVPPLDIPCSGPGGAVGFVCNRSVGPSASSAPVVPQTGCILADVGVCLLADTGVKLLVQ